jgi:hypothetical protein
MSKRPNSSCLGYRIQRTLKERGLVNRNNDSAKTDTIENGELESKLTLDERDDMFRDFDGGWAN